jgi:hypothetical protein
MKQWNLSRSSKFAGIKKVEPIPHAINPAGIAQIGTSIGNHGTGDPQHSSYRGDPINAGRGYKAPMNASMKTSKSGSQGRH